MLSAAAGAESAYWDSASAGDRRIDPDRPRGILPERMKTLGRAVRALAYAAVFLGAFGWLALEVRRLDRFLGGPLPSLFRFPGWVALAAGAALALACLVMFVAVGRGTAAPFDPPRQFVARGPYRFVRNPMYWGGFLALAGLGFASRSPAVLALTVLLAACVHFFVVEFEEPDLERRFGESYRDYKRRVRRWLPRIPGGPRAD